jgi:hypothetical protein
VYNLLLEPFGFLPVPFLGSLDSNTGIFILGALSLHRSLISSLSLGDNLSLNSK